MKFSDRVGKLAPYPFVEISRIIAEKRAAGADVVTFGKGRTKTDAEVAAYMEAIEFYFAEPDAGCLLYTSPSPRDS